MDAVELARRETALADAGHESRAARYRTAFKQLTAAGRTVIEHFVDETVAPNVRFTESETIRLAMKNEEEFRHAFNALCEATLNGRTPQPFLDELARQTGGTYPYFCPPL
jgi:hypothetical protein